jgi:hypothetical protein
MVAEILENHSDRLKVGIVQIAPVWLNREQTLAKVVRYVMMMFQFVVIFGRNSFRSIGELQGFWKSGLRLLCMKLKNDVRWAKRIFRVWGLRPLVILSRND